MASLIGSDFFLAFMIRCPMLFGGRPFWLSLPSLAFFPLSAKWARKGMREERERIEKEIPPIPKLENGTLSWLFLRKRYGCG